MSEGVRPALRRAVRERAKGRCEYCGIPDTESLFPHEPDHIISIKHGEQQPAKIWLMHVFSVIVQKGVILLRLIQ